MTDPITTAKTGIALVSEIMKAAGDNPQVKEAGSNLGQTALTITKTINNALLPLAAVNFAFDKARKYFDERFAKDLSTRVSEIPLADIVEPKASIAGPALQGLAFTHEEAPLRDMYLSLLATAMDGRIASHAHPAFVEIIKQLSSDEPELLEQILVTDQILPIVQVRVTGLRNEGWRAVLNHLMNPRTIEGDHPVQNPRGDVMVDNWLRLGLVEVTYSAHLAGGGLYDWVTGRPEYNQLRSQHENDTQTLTFGKGMISRTALGLQFAKAVGLITIR